MLCKIASSVYVTSSFLMLAVGGSFEGISSSEDGKAINMENLELMQDFRSLQSEKTVSGLLSVQSVSTLRKTQGCGVGSPVIRLRLLAISIIRLRLRTDSDLQLY